jgi:hypothetical protein
MFIISIFVFVLILGMFQANNEYFESNQSDYKWGLKSHKPKEEIKRHRRSNDDDKRRRNDDDNEWYPDYDTDSRETEEVIDTKVGEYKCYYVPGEDPECQKAFKKCSIKDHPDINKYILKSRIPPLPEMNNYILKTEIPIVEQDMTEYIHKGQLPDMSQFIPKSELPDMSNYVLKDDIPDIPDMSGYIPKNDLDKYQKKCPTFPECPTCPIPEGIDIKNYMLKSECKKDSKDYKITDDNKINFGDLLPSFMKGKSQCIVNDDDFRRTGYQKRC